MDRTRLRAVIERLYEGGIDAVPSIILELHALGAVSNVHVGRTELTPDETVEWYAGQALNILEHEDWRCVNTLHNILDKFVPVEVHDD